MCGIAGFWSFDRPPEDPEAILRRMAMALRHEARMTTGTGGMPELGSDLRIDACRSSICHPRPTTHDIGQRTLRDRLQRRGLQLPRTATGIGGSWRHVSWGSDTR